MPSTQIQNQKIFYTTNRKQKPITAVLVHGAGGRHQDWPAELRRMDGVETITPDLPGHGKSSKPGRESVDAYADFIDALVTSLGKENVVLIGHSMGSTISLTLGTRRPSWLKGLVLMGAAASMPVTPVILDNVKTDIDAVAEFFTKYAWGKEAKFQHKGFARRHILEQDPDVLYGDYFACNNYNVEDKLDQVNVPTLFISGEKDKFVRASQSQAVADQIEGASSVVIPAAGHMVMLEFEDQTAQAVTDYLKSNSFWS